MDGNTSLSLSAIAASALIFVLAVEIMAIKLRETKHIKGIEIKINSITGNLQNCQLADDTLFESIL
jgi:hypothetical protein